MNQLPRYLLQGILLLLLHACTQSTPPDPTAQQKAKALYVQVIKLRFKKPDLALLAADSILMMAKQQPIDTFEVVALVQKSLLLSEKRIMPEAIEIAQKALDIWEPVDGVFAKCKAWEQIGQCYLVQKNYDVAREYFQKELEAAPQCGEVALGIESFAASYIGEVYVKQGNLNKAIQYHQQAVDVAKKNGDPELIAGAYHALSAVFQKLGDQVQQLDCLKKAATSFDSTDYRRAASFLNLANTFSTMKLDDSSNYYIQLAYKMPEMPPQIKLIAMVGYGGVLAEKKEYETSRKLMEKAVFLADTIDDKERMGIALNQIGETYSAEKDYKKGLKYSLKADSVLQLPDTEASYPVKFEAARNIVRAQLMADGRYETAKQIDKMNTYQDSLGKEEYLEILANYKLQIQSDSLVLLSTQNQLQTAAIKTKNGMLIGSGFGFLLVSMLALVWRRNLKLSTENLEILGEQNQKLKNDNLNLSEDLERIRTQKEEDNALMLDQYISLPTRNNLALKLAEIMYVQAFGGGVYYVTPEKKHLVWHGFEACLKTLPEEFFVKTHRSYIVNKTFVEQISPSKIFLKSGEILPIGVTIKEEVQQRMGLMFS